MTRKKKSSIISKFVTNKAHQNFSKFFKTLKKGIDKKEKMMYNKQALVERAKNLEKITAQQVRIEAEYKQQKEFEKSNTHKDYMRV